MWNPWCKEPPKSNAVNNRTCFKTIVKTLLYAGFDYGLLHLTVLDYWIPAGVTGQQGMLTPPRHLISTLVYPGSGFAMLSFLYWFFLGITRLIMDCYFCYCSQHWYDDRPDCVLLLIWLVWWHTWLCPVVNMTGMITYLTVSCCSHDWYDYIPDSIMLFTWFDWLHTWLCPVVHMTGMMTYLTVSCCLHDWYDDIPDCVLLFTCLVWWHSWLCPVVYMTGISVSVYAHICVYCAK